MIGVHLHAFGLDLNPYESFGLWATYFAPYLAGIFAMSLILAYRDNLRNNLTVLVLASAAAIWSILRFWQTREDVFKVWGWGEAAYAPFVIAMIMIAVAALLYLVITFIKSKTNAIG